MDRTNDEHPVDGKRSPPPSAPPPTTAAVAPRPNQDSPSWIAVLGTFLLLAWFGSDWMRQYFRGGTTVNSPVALKPQGRYVTRPAPQPPSASPNTDGQRFVVPESKPTTDPEEIKADHVERYWKKTVADLHLLRFNHPDGDEPAHRFYATQLSRHRDLLKSAQRQAAIFVPEDIQDVVDRHLEYDTVMLDWIDEIQKGFPESKTDPDTRPVGEQVSEFMELLDSLTEEQFENAPPKIREALEALAAMGRVKLKQYEEVVLLQAQLRTRFPGRKFDLPKLNWQE